MRNGTLPIGSGAGIGVLLGAAAGLLFGPMLGTDGGIGLTFGVAVGFLLGGALDTARRHRAT